MTKGRFLGGSGQEGDPRRSVCAAQQASGTLVDGGYLVLTRQLQRTSEDRQLVGEVVFHTLAAQALKQRTGR